MTPKELRGRRMERRAHGLARPAGLQAAVELERIDDAAGLLLPGTALGGWASLRSHGNTWFDGWSPEGLRRVLVHCAPGAQLRRRDVVEPFRGLVHAAEITTVAGVAVSTMARAAFDEARMAPNLRSAVGVIDMAVSTTHGLPRTTVDDIWRVVDSHFKVRGIVQARRALGLAASRAASPLETSVRLVATLDAGLTSLLVNVPVFRSSGELLGVADLFDPETGLVIEVDGSGHREEEQHAQDNLREEEFERAGCVVVRVSAVDLRRRWHLVGRIVRAHRDAQRVTRRTWTIEPPEWWMTWPAAARWLP